MPTPLRVPVAARDAILAWYLERGRPLAFRRTRDPYAILVAEAMAQQTQAARAADHWERFIERFPTVTALASASPADVLRAWRGLGYDRRALALWRSAKIIVERHGGTVPASIEALQALPGVGPYTARAVAALAFGMRVGAVDVNVRRVLARIVAGDGIALTNAETQTLADDAVPLDRPGAWTHAVMDIGATVCRPRRPRCGDCPARSWCRYARDTAAGAAETPRRIRDAATPFPATNRWLRGRILDRLRDAPDAAWVVFDHAIGMHDVARVRAAAVDMAGDGVIEFDGGDADAPRARLPLA